MKNIFVSIFVILLLISFSACNGNSQKTNSELTKNTNDNSVEKIYDDFLSGKITAVYDDGTSINIDYLEEVPSPNTATYALLDRNGDSVPELCINNNSYITTFWISDGALKFWRVENAYAKILNNGNCLQTHYGGAPNHTDYSYNVYSYTGKVICKITLSVIMKNDIDVTENIYTQCVAVYSGSVQEAPSSIEISKEQFDKALDSIEKIGEAKISWKPIE